MATAELTFRISGLPSFRAQVPKEVITANTTLLDTFGLNESGEIVLDGWSEKIFDFFMTLLVCGNDELDQFFNEFEANVAEVWSIASFHEKFIRNAQMAHDNYETDEPRRPTLRVRQWFRRWWAENGEGFRGDSASDLTDLVMPAFHIHDAETFSSVTHAWFLHTNNKQAASINYVQIPLGSDEGGWGAINTHHPLLGNLAAVRADMIGKIEKALYYNGKRDGIPRGHGEGSTDCEDPVWCAMMKSGAYYKALKSTGRWPVRDAMPEHSILQVLTMLAESFNYINYDDRKDVPDRDVARSHLPPSQGAKNSKRCTVCVDADVKASFDRKVKSLIKTLLDDKKTWINVEQDGETVRMQVDDSFVGLCLDCLTKSKFGSDDADYWLHCLQFEYDHGCTIDHGQPTWYFSFLGRLEDMKEFQDQKKEKEQQQQQTMRRTGR